MGYAACGEHEFPPPPPPPGAADASARYLYSGLGGRPRRPAGARHVPSYRARGAGTGTGTGPSEGRGRGARGDGARGQGARGQGERGRGPARPPVHLAVLAAWWLATGWRWTLDALLLLEQAPPSPISSEMTTWPAIQSVDAACRAPWPPHCLTSTRPRPSVVRGRRRRRRRRRHGYAACPAHRPAKCQIAGCAVKACSSSPPGGAAAQRAPPWAACPSRARRRWVLGGMRCDAMRCDAARPPRRFAARPPRRSQHMGPARPQPASQPSPAQPSQAINRPCPPLREHCRGDESRARSSRPPPPPPPGASSRGS